MSRNNKIANTYVGSSQIYGAIENELEHILYDLSIQDVNERKEKAQRFENANRVAEFLKVKVDCVFRNRKVGKKVLGVDNKYYAIRVENKNIK